MKNQNKNLNQQEILLKIYESTEKIRKYLLLNRIFSIIKIVVILVPIVLAILYIPSYVEKLTAPYQEILNTTNQIKGNLNTNFLEDVWNFYK